MNYSKLTLAMLVGITLTACGGSGDDPWPDEPQPVKTYNIKSLVENSDGEGLANVVICYDQNANKVCDAAENSAVTDFSGNATIRGLSNEVYNKNAYILAIKDNKLLYSTKYTEDSSKLQADDSSIIVRAFLNPVTNLVTEYAEKNSKSFEVSLSELSNVFGIAKEDFHSNIKSSVDALVAFAESSAQKGLDVDNIADNYKKVEDLIDSGLSVEKVITGVVNNGFDVDPNELLQNNLPEGDFEFTVSDCVLVQFSTDGITDLDGDSLSYKWDFGDKTSSTVSNPLHLYTADGTYNVTLVVSDKAGQKTFKKTVVIKNNGCEVQPINPNFTFTVDPQASNKVAFSNGSIAEGRTYSWEFGDGQTSTEENPVHIYSNNGIYTVVLTVTEDGVSYKTSQTIDVDVNSKNNPPVADVETPVINGLNVKIANKSKDADNDQLTYNWITSNGKEFSSKDFEYKFEKSGTYVIKLIVSDGKSSVEKAIQVTVSDAAFSADITVESNSKREVSLSAKVNGEVSSDAKYLWNMGDGSSELTGKSVEYTYKKDGSFTIELTVVDGDKTVKTSKVVSVSATNALPSASFEYKVTANTVNFTNLSSDSDGDDLTYEWDFGDGNKSTDASPSHTYEFDGTSKEFAVKLTVSDGKQTSVVEKSVKVTNASAENNAPVADFTSSVNGTTVTFANKSSDADNDTLTYEWDFGDGETSAKESPSHTYSVDKETEFTVTLTVSDGKDTDVVEKTVKVSAATGNQAPVAKFTSKVSGTVATFTNASTDPEGDELTYLWDFGDGKTSDEESPSHTYPAESKDYTVTLTVSDGVNSSKTSSKVNVSVVQDASLDPDFSYSCTGFKCTLKYLNCDSQELTYAWDFGDGLASDKQNPQVEYTKGGSKTITLTISNGTATASKSYDFTLADAKVVLPTKDGLYLKTSYSHIYVWDGNNGEPFGKWPGAALTDATESAGWKFIDTSAISADKINFVISNNGSDDKSPDIKGVSPQGCFDGSVVIPLSDCSLSDQQVETISGGKKGNCPVPPPTPPCEGDDCPPAPPIAAIPWDEMDYAEYHSTADVSIPHAPYVVPDLAPGSYHENVAVTLKLEDADRNPTSGTIYYTLDNSRPTEDSAKYTGTIKLDDTSEDGLGTAYRLRTLSVGGDGNKQEQNFFWFVKKNATVAPATDFRDETIYFVVTARYYDGDSDNNYFCRDRFDPTDPSWRGDFKGLIEKLDYIKDMGFTAIWVTPPVENRSGLDYHGYHAYDWFQPDLRLESPGATYFDFIKAAHAKGIKVVQDVVLNHSSNYGIRRQAYIEKIPTKYYIDPAFGKDGIDNGPYQKNIGDYLSPNRCDNDNYVAPSWHKQLCAGDPDGRTEFTVKFKDHTVNVNNTSTKKIDARYFWSPAIQSYLPEKWYHVAYTNNWESVEEVQLRSMAGDCVDLKTENDNVKNYMNTAIKMYIDMGIDAIRIDTLKHMPRADVMAMTKEWQSYKPNMFVFGEALIKGFGDNTPSELLPWFYTRTGGTSEHSGDSGISVLDFSLMSTFRDNVTKGSVSQLGSVFERFDSWYADPTKLVTFFQNHDLTPDNNWSGNGAQHCCTDRVNSALAYNVLWTVRGIPVMYAGDERGVRVGMPPDLTGPNDLVGDTGRLYIGDSFGTSADSDPIIGHITDLNAIRKSSKALQRGTLKMLQHEPLVFERVYEDERAIVAIVGSGGGSVTVSGATNGSYTDVVTGQTYNVSGGSVSLGNIPGGSMRVLVKDYSGGKVTGKSSFLK